MSDMKLATLLHPYHRYYTIYDRTYCITMGILYDLYLARQKLDIVSRGQTLDGKIRVWGNAIICRLCNVCILRGIQ